MAVPEGTTPEDTERYLLQLKQKLLADLASKLQPAFLYALTIEQRPAYSGEAERHMIPHKPNDTVYFVSVKLMEP